MTIEEIAMRVSCTQRLCHEMKRGVGFMSDSQSMELVDRSLPPLERASIHALRALLNWSEEAADTDACEAQDMAADLEHPLKELSSSVRRIQAQEKEFAKHSAAEMKALHSTNKVVQRVSELALTSHWQLVDSLAAKNGVKLSQTDLSSLHDRASSRKQELLAADQRYCDAVRHARDGVMSRTDSRFYNQAELQAAETSRATESLQLMESMLDRRLVTLREDIERTEAVMEVVKKARNDAELKSLPEMLPDEPMPVYEECRGINDLVVSTRKMSRLDVCKGDDEAEKHPFDDDRENELWNEAILHIVEGRELDSEFLMACIQSLKTTAGQDAFSQSLTRSRSHQPAGRSDAMRLSRSSSNELGDLMLCFLDEAAPLMNVRSMMNVLAMAQSYHYVPEGVPEKVPEEDRESASNRQSTTSSAEAADPRVFLQSVLEGHPIWQKIEFWEKVFFDTLRDYTPLEKWHCDQELEEIIANNDNIVFGQLASVAINMIGLGHSYDDVMLFVGRMCQMSDLEPPKVKKLILAICSEYGEDISDSQTSPQSVAEHQHSSDQESLQESEEYESYYSNSCSRRSSDMSNPPRKSKGFFSFLKSNRR